MAEHQQGVAGSRRSPAAEDRVADADLADLEARDVFGESGRYVADCLQRRQSDAELHLELSAENFEGPSWDRFADELARYGFAVMLAWCRSGEIFRQCTKKGCFPSGPRPPRTEDDHQSLANDTLQDAIARFRVNALVGGGWKPGGGASLKSFFIGQCVLSFPNQFRRWRTDKYAQQELHAAIEGQGSLDGVRAHLDLCGEAADRAHALQALAEISDERTRAALLWKSQGYTNAEIGELLATSTGAVKELFARHKRRTQKAREGESHV